jgi:tetratricopeptide (TPR) repeat protein
MRWRLKPEGETGEKAMTGNAKVRLTMTLAALLGMSGVALAQSAQQQNPPAQQDKSKDKVQDLTLDNAAPAGPVNAEEDAAYKALTDASSDPKKRIELGEAFMQKYPQSRYSGPVLSNLTVAYLQTGDVAKMEATGDKEVALNPNDGQTLAILGQTIPRSFNPSAPDAAKRLDKAEQYSRRALEVIPTMPKPDTLTEEAFTKAKNQTLAMAHSGLGLVSVRRGKYSEAIPDLEQSVKLDPTPDPVNYYLLGLANEKASHFDDAVAAFNKCAALSGTMANTCMNGAAEAKKLSATELSAPK